MKYLCKSTTENQTKPKANLIYREKHQSTISSLSFNANKQPDAQLKPKENMF